MPLGHVAQAESSGEWVALKEWSGLSSNVTTEAFVTTAPFYRVSWTVTEVDRDGLIDIYVRAAGDQRLLAAAGNLRAAQRPSGSFEVAAGPGDYLLDIRGTGVKWRVVVEQPKGTR